MWFFLPVARNGLLGHFQKCVQERAYTKIGHRRSEENRRQLTGMHQLQIQFRTSRLQQIQFLDCLLQQIRFNKIDQLWITE